MLIGLTGSFGSGKSTVLGIFHRLGAQTLSADEIVHELLERPDVREEIKRLFGKEVVSSNGIDKKKLAARIFDSMQDRQRLESILHPLVYDRIMKFHRQHPDQVTVAEIPLLFESGRGSDFDAVIFVTCAQKKRLNRLAKRGFSQEEAKRRLAAQMPEDEKIRLSDFVVDNSGSIEATGRQVRSIWQVLKGRGKEVQHE